MASCSSSSYSSSLAWYWVIEALSEQKQIEPPLLKWLVSNQPNFFEDAPDSVKERLALRYLEEYEMRGAVGINIGTIDVAKSSEEILCTNLTKVVDLSEPIQSINEITNPQIRQFISQKRSTLPILSLHLVNESALEVEIPNLPSMNENDASSNQGQECNNEIGEKEMFISPKSPDGTHILQENLDAVNNLQKGPSDNYIIHQKGPSDIDMTTGDHNDAPLAENITITEVAVVSNIQTNQNIEPSADDTNNFIFQKRLVNVPKLSLQAGQECNNTVKEQEILINPKSNDGSHILQENREAREHNNDPSAENSTNTEVPVVSNLEANQNIDILSDDTNNFILQKRLPTAPRVSLQALKASILVSNIPIIPATNENSNNEQEMVDLQKHPSTSETLSNYQTACEEPNIIPGNNIPTDNVQNADPNLGPNIVAETSSDTDDLLSNPFEREKTRLLSSQFQATQDSFKMTEQNMCIKCDKGGQLLSCTSEGCVISVHKSCLGSATLNNFDKRGCFYCPFCTYSRATRLYKKAKKDFSHARNQLSLFLSKDNKISGSNINNQGDENRGRNYTGKMIISTENRGRSDKGKKINTTENRGRSDKGKKIISTENRERNDKSKKIIISTENRGRNNKGKKVISTEDRDNNNDNDNSTSDMQEKTNANSRVEELEKYRYVKSKEPIVDANGSCESSSRDEERENNRRREEERREGERQHKRKMQEQKRVAHRENNIGDANGSSESESRDEERENRRTREEERREGERQNKRRIEEEENLVEERENNSGGANGSPESESRDEERENRTREEEREKGRTRDEERENRTREEERREKERGNKRRENNKRRRVVPRYANPIAPPGRRNRLLWSVQEEEALREGMQKFGASLDGRIPWKEILEYRRHVFDKTRLPGDLKDKWRNMMERESSTSRQT